ncbi:FAD-binding oxidoreductase [Aliikangiella sp. G2MR2-5]|uniref:NAD(P)/FAD-dependent oxidoreductase n=1 Tax=Aliikangiella sp. G2MR2-5 TaxID=2788943 RepID=UPI0018AB51AA|nr:FAD-binding oxidoreductase [Aliikangiella sp. G2MR2-5]
MLNYPNSYYAATLNEQNSYPLLQGAKDFETCVVGGGYAGLMTALGLIERGHTSVAIVEQNKVGWGASGRNGGFVFGGYSLGPEQLVAQVGLERARLLYGLTLDAVDLIRNRVKTYEIQCDLVDQGVILANWFKKQAPLLQLQAFMRDSMGVEWEYLSPSALRQLVNTERYTGGLFEPNAMHFHPLNYARGIASAIKNKGGEIYEGSPAINIEMEGSVKTVSCSNGEIRCKNLVIAGGGYLSHIASPLRRSVLPIATYVMATEPLGDKLEQSINTKAAIYDTRFAFDYYRPLNDSRILWGGRVSANTNSPGDLRNLLYQDMLKVFPEMTNVKIDFHWQGFMSYARHQMAQIGQLYPNVWYGIGFGGHGVAPTTLAGEVLAEAITGASEKVKAFETWGLPWNGGVFGPPAAQVSYWWYQLRDWLKEKLDS